MRKPAPPVRPTNLNLVAEGPDSTIQDPNAKQARSMHCTKSQQTNTDKRDRFAQMPQFAFDALRDKPASWTLTYQLLQQYADHRTAVTQTSYGGILANLARHRIHLTKNGARYIIEALQALGLIQRDRQANRDARRLRVIIKRSIKTTATQLMAALGAVLTNIGLRTSLQREKPQATGIADPHRYQMNPTGSLSKNKSELPNAETRTPEAQQAGKERARMLLANIKRGLV